MKFQAAQPGFHEIGGGGTHCAQHTISPSQPRADTRIRKGTQVEIGVTEIDETLRMVGGHPELTPLQRASKASWDFQIFLHSCAAHNLACVAYDTCVRDKSRNSLNGN